MKQCETCRFDNKYESESICATCSRHYSDCYVPKEEPQTDELFEIVRENYYKVNADYIAEQIEIANGVRK